jgi:hypothetical protein
MKTILCKFALAATIILAPVVQAATVNVNVDGITHASQFGFATTEGPGGVDQFLVAGTYQLSFIKDTYTAFNRFDDVSGCDGSGANCGTGWENSVRYIIGPGTFTFGDGDAFGGAGPLGTGDGYYGSDALSLTNAGIRGNSL